MASCPASIDSNVSKSFNPVYLFDLICYQLSISLDIYVQNDQPVGTGNKSHSAYLLTFSWLIPALTVQTGTHLDSDSVSLPFWFNCPINVSCLKDILSLGNQLLWELAPESNWFGVSGCVLIIPVSQLRDTSSFPAFKISLHGNLTICLLCGQGSSPISTEPTLSSALCPWFTASGESSTQSGWTRPNSLNPPKTLTRLLNIFFILSHIHCQTSSSRDYWENESVSSWSPIYL